MFHMNIVFIFTINENLFMLSKVSAGVQKQGHRFTAIVYFSEKGSHVFFFLQFSNSRF